MKSVLFFALRDDLLLVLNDVEERMPLKYVRFGRLSSPRYESLDRGSAIPFLGLASADSVASCTSFVVSSRDTSLAIREVSTSQGSVFFMDQLINPDSVTLTPGGVRGEGVLLHGRVATASDTAASQHLMRLFGSAIRKRFSKIKAFYVGPAARRMLEAGSRLTVSVNSPRELDLTLL